MKPVPSSLAKILQDFCHMEWYEIKALRDFVNNSKLTELQQLMVNEFKHQLSEAIELESLTPEQYIQLTQDECSSNYEVAIKLKNIKWEVFGC